MGVMSVQSNRYQEIIKKINIQISKLEEDINNVKNEETKKALEYCIALKKSHIKKYERFERDAINGLEVV